MTGRRNILHSGIRIVAVYCGVARDLLQITCLQFILGESIEAVLCGCRGLLRSILLHKLPLELWVMVQDLLREGLLLFRHIQLMERWLLLLYHRTLLIEAALTVARMVWKEKREIVPEIWLCLHLLYDLTDMLVEVITEGKHAH